MPDYLERGRKALEQCGLIGKENDYIWQLSGGQTHLLALSGAVSLQPEVLILDEPIAQLDPMHADKIYAVLRELNEKYGKIKYLIYQIKIIIQSFYPLMLNTAKRSRTTVEVLEIKGYRYAAVNKEVKKIKLSAMKVSNNDLMFLSLSFLWVAVTILIFTLI